MKSTAFLLLILAGCPADQKETASPSMAGDDEDWSDTGTGWSGDDEADTGNDTGDDGGADTGEDTATDATCDDVSAEDVVFYLSADDSNSQAGPVLARAAVETGHAPTGTQRLWEYLNYHTFDYTPAEAGHVDVVAQMRANDAEGEYTLLVAVVAPAVDAESRRPLNLTYSVDTSGSMEGDPLRTVQATMRTIAGELQEGDVVSIVKWSDSTTLALDSLNVTGPDDPTLLDAIDGLVSGGSTDLSRGLQAAYDVAANNWSADRTNRVILMSDGGANTGETDEDLIAAYADDAESEGIYLIGVGVGEPGSYDDALMDTVTDLGKGAYVFVDSADEAERQFTGDRFLANLEVAARNVQLAMTLPAGWVIQRFHGEEISTDPAEVREQHLAPNDVMLYHMVLDDCGADPDVPFTFSATWQDARGADEYEDSAAPTVASMLGDADTQIDKANAVIAWAKGLYDAPRSTDPEAYGRDVLDEVRGAQALRPTDTELDELEALVMRWVADL